MKKFLSFQYLTSACFVALLGIMLAGSLKPCYYTAYQVLQDLRSGRGISVDQITDQYNDAGASKTPGRTRRWQGGAG